MALEKTFNLENYGLELLNSYHKIDSIHIEDGRVNFVIKIFASKIAREQGANPLQFKPDSVDYSRLYQHHTGDDLIAKLYDYVKTVNPEYQTATLDV